MGGLFGKTSTATTTTAVSDLSVQTSTLGKTVALLWGTNRVTGNLIWYGDFASHAQSSSSSSGGKGGGGSSGASSYTYTCSFAMGLCEGPIQSFGTVFAGKETGTMSSYGLTGMAGNTPQTPWTYLQSAYPSKALGYSGLCYAAAANYDLDTSTSLPNFSFEIVGKLAYEFASSPDALPKDVAVDFLTNGYYGAGFPSSYVGDLSQWDAFCKAAGILVSPLLDTAAAAQSFIDDLGTATCSVPVWKSTQLVMVPYADESLTGNGVAYTPDVDAVYDLTDDDFIDDGSTDPITVKRGNAADAYNSVTVEYLDRSNSYNTATVTAMDQANIDLYGLRQCSTITLHMVTTAAVAQQVAQFHLQRYCYVRNTYEFSLGWRYCLLEPMDVVTINDACLGLSKYPVRITEIDEDDTGLLKITAEDFPDHVSTPSVNSVAEATRYAPQYNASPGSVNVPVIFEAPDVLTSGSGYEIWAAVSGGSLYGGCVVWVSEDGDTYTKAGTISGAARHGYLTAALPLAADPDETNPLAVDLSISGGALASGTQLDADSYNTLCYVDGELVSYETATLTGVNAYNLGYLRRGAYDSTIGTHNSGTQFARLDGSIFKYAFDSSLIGKTIYIKFAAFNLYGGGTQSLADCEAYSYKVTGSALNSTLPNVENVSTNFVSGLTQIYWDAISDFRQPNVDYEVRLGPTWASAKTLGRTSLCRFTAVGDGNYWIAAHYLTSSGANVYSAAPAGIDIVGATLTSNIIATFDEAAAGWLGTISGGAWLQNNIVQLQGAGNILTDGDFLNTSDVIWYGGVAATGEYDLPEVVNIGRVTPCNVLMSYSAFGQSIYANALALANFLGVDDFFGAALGQVVSIQPQIATAGANGVYGIWSNFQPGLYNAQYFKARVLISSSNAQVSAMLTDFVFEVDVPTRTDSYQVIVPAVGVAVTYTSPFNGGPGALTIPALQATILNASAGDDLIITSQTVSGCFLRVLNNGSGISRTVNLQAQGY
jgi:hypothetical protein